MSVFDALVSEVWAEAREDGGTLLAAMAPPSSDAARAAYALRLPQLDSASRRLREHAALQLSGADPDGAELALARAEGAAADGRDLDAVRAMSEALRMTRLPCQQLRAREGRADALLRMGEAEASLQDLRVVRDMLEGSSPPDMPRYTRTLLAMSACLELQRDSAQAEAVLREAMGAVRDDSATASSAKAEAVSAIVQRLKAIGGSQLGEARRPLVSSGLDALPPLFGGPHTSLPCAAAALEEMSDAHRGRHLVAARDIPAGSALIVERPYAWSLSGAAMATHCLHCCRPVLAPQPCPHCSNVAFCGPDCQAAALSQYHRVECPVLGQLVADESGAESGVPGLSAMALLAFRIVVRAAGLGSVRPLPGPLPVALPEAFVQKYGGVEGGDRKDPDDEYGAVFGQVTHSEARTPADLLVRALTAAFLVRCLEAGLGAGLRLAEDQALLLATAFLRHLQSCSCNAYQVSEQRVPGGAVRGARVEGLGGACYATVSLLNHACSPNVARHSHGNVCVVRAVRAVAKGSELLDNYGPNFLELELEGRRAALSRQYMFRCECEACRLGWPTLQGLERLPANSGTRKQQQQLQQLRERLQAALQGLLQGRTAEALRAALRYSAALQALQARQPGRPPCTEQVRADQVVALCWGLAGNVARF